MNETIRINGREITVILTYSQSELLYVLVEKFNCLVAFAELENALSHARRDLYHHHGFRYYQNCRVHITAIRKQINPHGFDILSKRNAGYKLIDKANPMTDPRDEFEIIYATLFRYPDSDDNPLDLDGRIEYAKAMRNDAGGYNFNSDLQGAFSVYLMAISKNKGE